MKKRTFAALGLLTLLASTCAFGRQAMKVSVPFEFHVGATVMPAGEYHLNWSFGLSNHLLLLESDDSQTRMWILADDVLNAHDGRTQGSVVFHKYGDAYFLSEVWSFGSDVGSALHESKVEREAALHAALRRRSLVVLAARR
ncbi:MAG: hypothetical protein P4K98_09985 [Bryobacteraceae bacterium]|nr:hypothetical protein [Bryobacteraceae bacterium]